MAEQDARPVQGILIASAAGAVLWALIVLAAAMV